VLSLEAVLNLGRAKLLNTSCAWIGPPQNTRSSFGWARRKQRVQQSTTCQQQRVWRQVYALHVGQLPVSRVGANAQCGLTPRSSGRATAWPLGRAAALFIIVRAAQGPRRCAPLNSNVRPSA
jgi:hypothetical protein